MHARSTFTTSRPPHFVRPTDRAALPHSQYAPTPLFLPSPAALRLFFVPWLAKIEVSHPMNWVGSMRVQPEKPTRASRPEAFRLYFLWDGTGRCRMVWDGRNGTRRDGSVQDGTDRSGMVYDGMGGDGT